MADKLEKLEEAVADGKAQEIQLADMETRLRGTILRIIRPALDTIEDMNARLRRVNEKVNYHGTIIKVAEKLRSEVAHWVEHQKMLGDKVDQQDRAHRHLERTTSVNITDLQNSATEAVQKLEDHRTSLKKHQLDLDKCWEELERQPKVCDENYTKLWRGISNNSQKSEKIREDMLQMFAEMSTQREQLMDSLYGDDKGLTKLARDLTALTIFCSPINEVQRVTNDVARRQVQVEEMAAKNQKLIDEHNVTFITFRQELSVQVAKLKEDLRRECNGLVAHHATLMGDLRREYEEEFDRIRSLRADVQEFKAMTSSFCQKTNESVLSESARMDVLQREIMQDLEELQRRLKKDRLAWELELRGTRKDMENDSGLMVNMNVKVEFVSRLLGLIIKGQRMSSALFVQDFTDRGAERWFTVPTALKRRAEAPVPADVLENNKLKNFSLSHQKVTLDVKKGVVCGEYLPGNVKYSGMVYERRDLLLLCHKLMEKVHDAYMLGHDQESINTVGDFPQFRDQPGANGSLFTYFEQSQTASKPTTATKDSGDAARSSSGQQDSEDARPSPVMRRGPDGRNSSQASGPVSGTPRPGCYSRQRPASQGQPQAMGSRGRNMGSLGATSPMPNSVRLPLISGEANGPSEVLTAGETLAVH